MSVPPSPSGGAPVPATGTAESGAGAAPGVTDWRQYLTGPYQPLQSDKTLEAVKGKDWSEAGPVLAKNYVETKKLVGDSVRIPKPDAKPEEIRGFWDRIGVPKDITGYGEVKLESVEDMPDIDTTMVDGLVKPAFLRMGLTARQGQDALNLFREYTVTQRRQFADEMIDGQESLRSDWAMNFDRNVKIAQSAFNKYTTPALQKLIRMSQLDMHPDFLRGWYDIGQQLVEDGLIEGDTVPEVQREDLTRKITEIRAEIRQTPEGTRRAAELQSQLEQLYVTRDGRAIVGGTTPQR